MTQINGSLISALSGMLGTTGVKALHEPNFSGNEWVYIKDCLDTGWVSSSGKYVDGFELELARFTGAKHAIAVVNGTAALHISLILAGVRPDEEVLMPALSFVATANAAAYCHAVPNFVDVDSSSLGMNPAALETYLKEIAVHQGTCWYNRRTGRRLAAIVPMHTLGHPADIGNIVAIGEQYCIPVVEDAAESLGSFVGSQHTGTFGLLGAISFNGNKIITTGGGGAIITNDSALAAHAKHLTTTSKRPHAWEFFHDEVGFNYRMPNINAAMGCAQLEQMPAYLAAKRALAEMYMDALRNIPEVSYLSEPAGTTSNYWLNALRLGESALHQRDELLRDLVDAGYQCRPLWTPLNRLPMYQGCPRSDLSVSDDLAASVIKLPSSPGLLPSGA